MGQHQTESAPDTQVLEKTQKARPWKVLVHDDPVSLMSYVVHVFQKVFGFSKQKAEKHMLEVHEQGQSVLWTGEREKAEVYAGKLQGYHLRTTLEQDE